MILKLKAYHTNIAKIPLFLHLRNCVIKIYFIQQLCSINGNNVMCKLNNSSKRLAESEVIFIRWHQFSRSHRVVIDFQLSRDYHEVYKDQVRSGQSSSFFFFCSWQDYNFPAQIKHIKVCSRARKLKASYLTLRRWGISKFRRSCETPGYVHLYFRN